MPASLNNELFFYREQLFLCQKLNFAAIMSAFQFEIYINQVIIMHLCQVCAIIAIGTTNAKGDVCQLCYI